MGCNVIKSKFYCGLLIGLCVFQLCLAEKVESEDGGKGSKREARLLGGLFGPPPLPGDIASPVVCERYCRNRCLNSGYSGYLAVPGCNQFCDCSYYFGGGGFFG